MFNGVKQGGMISHVQFCIYLDGLCKLPDEGVVCYIGQNFRYANDIVLPAPTARALHFMLDIKDKSARQYSIIFIGLLRTDAFGCYEGKACFLY